MKAIITITLITIKVTITIITTIRINRSTSQVISLSDPPKTAVTSMSRGFLHGGEPAMNGHGRGHSEGERVGERERDKKRGEQQEEKEEKGG